MPFVSQKDKRQTFQSFQFGEYVEEPSFSEVFQASVGMVIDEELSISSYLNNEMFEERNLKVRKLREEGFDVDAYTNNQGKIDFTKLSRDTGEQIETDEVLTERRNKMLRQRREYAQDVIDRGSGYAQFFGMATGFMLDPINIATLPLATAGVSLKSLGVVGSALAVAKREAGVALASELAIQPLVYQHKHDIDSPFQASDALANIAIAATGAAMIGGVAGGLAGYFRKVKTSSEEMIGAEPGSTEELALQTLERVADDLEMVKKRSIYSDMADEYAAFKQEKIDEKIFAEYERSQIQQISALEGDALKAANFAFDSTGPFTISNLQKNLKIGFVPTTRIVEQLISLKLVEPKGLNENGMPQYATIGSKDVLKASKKNDRLIGHKNKTIKEMESRVKTLEGSTKLGRIIAEYGGLNERAWSAEAGISKKEFPPPKAAPRKPFYRAGDAGLTPDQLAERLSQDGFIARYDQGLAVDFVEDLLRFGDRYVDPDVDIEIASLQETIDSFRRSSDADVEKLYRDAVERDIKDDIEMFREFETKRAQFNEPSRTQEKYFEPEPQKAAPATVTERERDILERNGLAEDYDADMQAFDNLENPQIYVDDEFIDAKDFMKALDDEIEGINSVLECTLG